jgi:hypothetical protein
MFSDEPVLKEFLNQHKLVELANYALVIRGVMPAMPSTSAKNRPGARANAAPGLKTVALFITAGCLQSAWLVTDRAAA